MLLPPSNDCSPDDRGRVRPPSAPKLPESSAATPTGELPAALRPAAGSFVGSRVDETLAGIGLNYGMEPPSVGGVASVRDLGKREVRLRLR